MLLLLSPRNSLSLITLKLDALDINIANEITTLKKQEIIIHNWCIIDLYILPLFGEGNVCQGTIITEVAQFAMKFSFVGSFKCDRHLAGLIGSEHNIGYGLKLYIPEVITRFGCVNFHTVSTIKGNGVTISILIRFPTYGLIGSEILAGQLRIYLFRIRVGLVANKLLQPTNRLL